MLCHSFSGPPAFGSRVRPLVLRGRILYNFSGKGGKRMSKPTLESHFSDLNAEIVILSGVRYCLSRSSYAPGACVEYLTYYWPFMTDSLRANILEDIRKNMQHGIKDKRIRELWGSFLHRMSESGVEGE